MFKVLATCLLISAASVAGAQSVFAVDTGATVLTWTGKKVMGQHQGHIHVQHGSVLWRATGLHGCEVVIDMNSITIIGMDPEGETQLGNHLRSADFSMCASSVRPASRPRTLPRTAAPWQAGPTTPLPVT